MTETLAAILGLLVVLLDGFVIVRAVTRDHGVERTLAWIFAIIALPGIGAIAYVVMASPSVRRTRARRVQLTGDAAPEDAPIDHEALAGADATARSLFALATRLTGLPVTRGNTVRPLVRNEQAFERIEEAIRAARRSVLAEYYLVRSDMTGRRFLELLAEKAREGIEVRLIYDAMGSLGIDAQRLRALEAAGGHVTSFLPLNPFSKRWAVHLRNHRKLILVDDCTVFTGGMNVGDEYSGRIRRGRGPAREFRDTHLEIHGPASRSFRRVFLEDWLFATEELLGDAHPDCDAPAAVGEASALVAPLPSGPDQLFNATRFLFLAALGVARTRVLLTSPYFIPDEPMEQALLCAALRGVEVRLLTPERCDVRLATAAARSYYGRMLRGGVRIHLYEPSMLHAKTLVVDDSLCVVGSANTDIRSFELNFEVGALISDRGFLDEMAAQYARDLDRSRELSLDEVEARSLFERLRDSLARLMSPLL